MSSVLTNKPFSKKINDHSINLYSLYNKNGIELYLTNYGLRVVSLKIPDKKNKFVDVVLGFDKIEDYLNDKSSYFGSIVGQYANRIEGGRLIINNISFQLDKNEGKNHLHGGRNGYHCQLWDVVNRTDSMIEFRKFFKNGQNGYPGNLEVYVKYVLTDNNEFKIYYSASSDKPTTINLSHHSYFNLKGHGEGDIKDHIVTINANKYIPVREDMIPKKSLDSVKKTPFDFRNPKAINKDLDFSNEQLKIAKGYDHNFVLNNSPKNLEGLVYAARVEEPETGRIMEVYTTEPGLHLYTGNFIDDGLIGKNNQKYAPYSGFCLETQHFPNSPNRPDFPSTLLIPKEIYTSSTIYKFLIKD